ncbi:MAG: hypothetical protein R2750_08450 [Bacteroidales bacterium]
MLRKQPLVPTRYDLQTNTSTQNRIHMFDDGTIGAIWTMGYALIQFYDLRGTGYSYFDSNAWEARAWYTHRKHSLPAGLLTLLTGKTVKWWFRTISV